MTGASAGARGGEKLHGYWRQSRDLLNSLVLVLPLLVIYQAGLFATNGATLNGADFATVVILRNWGGNGLLVFNGVLIAAGLVGLGVLRGKGRFDPKIALPLVVESTIYAFLLGIVITQVLSRMGIRPLALVPLAAGLEQHGLLARFCLALGAGVIEELVFRLGLFSGLVLFLRKLKWPEPRALAAGVVASSVLFSLAHYMGPEPFALYTFVYRTLAGALFCGLFLGRGLAVAVYTHAIYDVLVMIVFARS